MYVRTVKGRTLTLTVSGKLWQRSLVMRDKETGSLWSHLLGEAMQGPLKGAELERLPSAMTSWKSWRKEHPGTTVVMLPRTSRRFLTSYYRNPKAFVMGYVSGAESRAWGFEQMEQHPVINDVFDKTPLLVVFETESKAPYLYERRLAGKTLVFVFAGGKLLDAGTRSEWNPATGKCVRGTLQGKQLKPLPGIVSFRRAWQNFHPRSGYWRPAP